MIDPVFWLGLSIMLVALSLTAVLIVALPALQELARAARSAEKLFDTLGREFPPTLEAIRLTGLEISELTDEINEGAKGASGIVKQANQSVSSTKEQAENVQDKSRGVVAGVKAAWKTWNRPSDKSRSIERIQASQNRNLELRGRTKPPLNPISTEGQPYQQKNKNNPTKRRTNPNRSNPPNNQQQE
jgi:uncharacterized protein YoxC